MGEEAKKPAGLATSVLDFVLRNSLLWAGLSLVAGVVILALPAAWFGDPWGPPDRKYGAAAIQWLVAYLFSVIALVRTRFSEADRGRPSWLLVLRAVGLTAGLFVVSLVTGIILLILSCGGVLALPVVLVLFALGGAAHLRGGTPKEISDRRASRIAPAIMLTTLTFAAVLPAFIPPTMAVNEVAAIAQLRSLDDLRAAGKPVSVAFAEETADWPKAADGTPTWHAYAFRLEKLESFGGECVVARPTEYNWKGLNTFVLAPDGVVYQRDVGYEGEAVETWDPDAVGREWMICE